MKKTISLLLSFVLVIGITANTPIIAFSGAVDELAMSITFIDCGQGDAVFITSEDESMLVDAGKASNVSNVVSYLDSVGVSEIDYVVSSHPDEDHIGGMPTIYEKYQVNESIYSSFVASTSIYNKYMDDVKAEPSSVYYAADDNNEWEFGDATVDVICDGKNYSNANDASVVLKVSCGNTSLLLTGDISNSVESDLVASNENIDIDILKVAHHGSASSSSQAFLAKTSPKMAVISVGADNSYGHPTQAALDRIGMVCTNLYRTDINGTIVVKVVDDVITCEDGVITDSGISYCKARTVYVTATGKKYHESSLCSNMKNPIAKKLSEAKSAGYTACSKCVSDDFELGAVPHTPSSWITISNATASASGTKHKECTQCGEVLETATIPQLKCSKPTLKTISNTASGVKVTWGKVTGADSYEIYRKVKGGSWSKIGTAKSSATAYTDKTAKSGTTYYYTVRAKNEAGLSSYNTSGISIKRLATPALKTVSNTSTGVKITWGKVTGVSTYKVYRKISKTGSWKYIGKTTSTSYTDKTAKAGTSYYYTVQAYSGSVKSSYNADGLSIRRLSAPKISSAVSQKSGVLVKWNKIAGAQGYVVYRQTGSGSYSKIATVKGISKITYTDKSAKKGKKYTYKIVAYYGNSYSAYSNTKTITDKY